MSVSTNDFKNGMTLELDDVLFQVVEFQHVKPGKGGAFVRTKLRNVKTGAVIERTFNAGVKVGLAIVERKGMQYLYSDGTDFVFMDPDTYDQVHVAPEVMGDAGKYLAESAEAQVAMHEGVPIAVDLPASVVLAITDTAPGAKGDTKTGRHQARDGRRRARWCRCRCSSKTGERIKVDTRSGDYIERVKG